MVLDFDLNDPPLIEDNVTIYTPSGFDTNMEYSGMPQSSNMNSLTNHQNSSLQATITINQPNEQIELQTVASVGASGSEGFPPHIRSRILRFTSVKRAAREIGHQRNLAEITNGNDKSNENGHPPTVVEKPPQQKEPTFSCPICMEKMVEETSTKCGHIFCKDCITSAILLQGKCPICRRKLGKGKTTTSRVYLPSINF